MKKEIFKQVVGANIRHQRVSRGMTIDELAELMELTPSFVGLIERGTRGATAYNLLRIATIFDVSVERLYSDSTLSKEQLLEESLVKIKRDRINSISSDLNEIELDFVIACIHNVKRYIRKTNMTEDKCEA